MKTTTIIFTLIFKLNAFASVCNEISTTYVNGFLEKNSKVALTCIKSSLSKKQKKACGVATKIRVMPTDFRIVEGPMIECLKSNLSVDEILECGDAFKSYPSPGLSWVPSPELMIQCFQ